MIAAAALAAGVTAACSAQASRGTTDLRRLEGAIKIDGSSTVYPITEAIAEEFSDAAPKVRVTVGVSGTGGGFKRFATGETDISNASRPIKKEEAEHAKEGKVDFIEIPVAYDGLSIVVNPKNTWVEKLTIDDLKRIFLDGSTVSTWSDVNPAWPDVPLKIFSPGTDSGTFDYFKEIVASKDDAIRSDMSVSEDDNILVRGVTGDEGAIGFFGCAYYFENKEKLRIVPIVNPKSGKAVTPSATTIEDGSYAPFSRPLFIYVARQSADRPEVEAFVKFYLDKAPDLVTEVGYVKLPAAMYDRARANYTNRRLGTQFLDAKGEKVSGPLPSVYK
jgi:phosphate transport system substrate-binding protein